MLKYSLCPLQMVKSLQFSTPLNTDNFSSVKRELKHQLMLPAFNWHPEYTKQCPGYLIFKHDTDNLAGEWESFRILYPLTISCLRFHTSFKYRVFSVSRHLYEDFLLVPSMTFTLGHCNFHMHKISSTGWYTHCEYRAQHTGTLRVGVSLFSVDICTKRT